METARVRASDAEREAYAERIRTAVGEGRYSIDEGDQRMSAVYATRYRDELGPQVADLPPDPPAPVPTQQGRRPAGRRGPGWYPWVPFGPLMIFAVLAGVWMFNGFWPAVPLVLLTLFVVRRVLWWRYRGWRH